MHVFKNLGSLIKAASGPLCWGVLAVILNPAFESEALCPLPIQESGIFPMEEATMAYQAALGKSKGKRIVLQIHSSP